MSHRRVRFCPATCTKMDKKINRHKYHIFTTAICCNSKEINKILVLEPGRAGLYYIMWNMNSFVAKRVRNTLTVCNLISFLIPALEGCTFPRTWPWPVFKMIEGVDSMKRNFPWGRVIQAAWKFLCRKIHSLFGFISPPGNFILLWGERVHFVYYSNERVLQRQ